MRPLVTTACALALAFTLFAGGASAGGGLFDYDASTPLHVRLGSAVTSTGVVRQELSYAATPSLRLKALFVHPTGSGPWPLVIWSPGAGGDRRQQLPEAVAIARRGSASLLVDEVPIRPGCRDGQKDLGVQVAYVVSRRRAVDLAATLSGVDTRRIAAAGFSRGAAVTAALAGVEHRIRAFALKSGRGHFTGYIPIFCTALKRDELAAYVKTLGVVDPVRWLPKTRGAALLLQNGTRDGLSPRADVLALYAAARKPKELHWYRASHDLDAAATADRADWLLDHLRAP